MIICPRCRGNNYDGARSCGYCGLPFYYQTPALPNKKKQIKELHFLVKVLLFLVAFIILFVFLYIASKIITRAMMKDATDMTIELMKTIESVY